MPNYPINVPLPKPLPRGLVLIQAQAIRRNIEQYINDNSRGEAVRIYSYQELADAAGFNIEIVRRFLMPIGGGNNGITVNNDRLED